MIRKDFVYFDGDAEREEVVRRVQDVRQEVFTLANQVPETDHFNKRYFWRSLSQLLIDMWSRDVGGLLLINLAAQGMSFRPPDKWVTNIRRARLSFYKQRPIAATLRDLQHKEADIVRFIREVPLDVIHRDVYPPRKLVQPMTVEEAVQFYFVMRWQQDLDLMRKIERLEN